MASNLDRLMRHLAKNQSVRKLRSDEYMSKDRYFVDMVGQLLSGKLDKTPDGWKGSELWDIDKETAAKVQKIMDEHQKVFLNSIAGLLAGTEQLIEKLEELHERRDA